MHWSSNDIENEGFSIPVSRSPLLPGGRPGAVASNVSFAGARPADPQLGRARGRSLSLCCDWPNRPWHALCCVDRFRPHSRCGCRKLLRYQWPPGLRRRPWQPWSPPRPPLWPPPVVPVFDCDLPVSQAECIWSVPKNTKFVSVSLPDRSGSTERTPIN